jgi:hypothetical protein
MFKQYILGFVIAMTTLTAFADNEETYKDDIPFLISQIGQHKKLNIEGYKVNKENEGFIASESKTPEKFEVDTDVSDLSKFEYYLREDGNIIARLTYSNEKVYKADILIQAISFRSDYRYPSYVISGERQSDFYRHDVVDYLLSTGWVNKGMFENEYVKDNYIIKVAHSPDYSLILEITDKDLVTELNSIKMDKDTYKEDDEYLKGIYTNLMSKNNQ